VGAVGRARLFGRDRQTRRRQAPWHVPVRVRRAQSRRCAADQRRDDRRLDLENPLILAAYNFSRFRTIVDVGGGHGLLLGAILQHAPNARGVLYDLESVVAGAQPILEAAGVLDRCTIESGSFFDSVPPGGDAYMLKHIVHDWAEPEALEILGNVRRAMNPDGTLLLVEIAIPPDNTPHFGKLHDLQISCRSLARSGPPSSTPSYSIGRASGRRAWSPPWRPSR
jgi:O-methyltransferase domain